MAMARIDRRIDNGLIHPPRGPGEAFGTYTSQPATLPRHSPSQLSQCLMSPPSSQVLQQLHLLSGSPSVFHDQLINVLYGEEYRQCVPNLQGDDLVWLVDYLDKVSRYLTLPRSLSAQARVDPRWS